MSAKATKGPYKITRGEIWSADECLGVVYRTEAWTSGEKVRTDDQATAALLAASWSMAEVLERLVRWNAVGMSIQYETLYYDIIPAARAALRLAKGD